MQFPTIPKTSEKNILDDIFSVIGRHPFLILGMLTMVSCGIFFFCDDKKLSPFSLFSLFILYTIVSVTVIFFIKGITSPTNRFSQYHLFTITISIGLIVTFLSAVPENNIVSVFWLSLAVSLTFSVFLFAKGKLNTKYLSAVIIFLGFALRLTYILYTTIYERQHDNYTLGHLGGHLGYITHFANDLFSLPKENVIDISQYYHPPLHHFIAGLFLNCLEWTGFEELNDIGECIQYLTLFYSSVCMILIYKILRFFKVNGLPLLAGISIVAFHPTMIILSGSVNNDILSVAFMLGAIYNALLYYRSHTYYNILKTALCVGLAMMSKLSGWLAAPAVAVIFITVMITENKQRVLIFKQWLAFGIVCAPLGLWWSIRCLIEYDMPIGYVMGFKKTIAMYLGDKYTVWQRLTDFSSFQFESVYDQYEWYHCPYYEYNPTIGLFKTAMFDEAQYGIELDFWATALFWVNILLVLLSLIAIVYVLRVKSTVVDNPLKLSLLLNYAVPVVSYYIFCMEYPFTCTMNVRYVVPSVLTSVIFISLLMQSLKDKQKTVHKPYANIILGIYSVTTAVFCILAIVTYVRIGHIPAVYDGVVLQ